MKLYIIGHPGSGKTYLADKLSKKSGIKKIDTDVLFDKHPFYALSRKLYTKALDKLLIGKESWIIDGYHAGLMPDELWKSADKVIYLDIPREELKRNIYSRYKKKRQNKEFSHWQSTYVNNLKNYGQIKFQDKKLKADIIRIKALLSREAKFTKLKTRSEIEQFVSQFSDEA
jgi:adenylate kinase family enzyme